MTVTSQFMAQKRPLARRYVPSPYINPPKGRRAIGRLGFLGPTDKQDCSVEELLDSLNNAALPGTIFFLDTNVFTTKLSPTAVKRLLANDIRITPGVWKELQPWLKSPYLNQPLRDRVIAAIKAQCRKAESTGTQTSKGEESACNDQDRVEVNFIDDNLLRHAYKYYFGLLSLRKCFGPMALSVLSKKLGRPPTNDELIAEIQGRCGERGFLLAKKGIEKSGSQNMLVDEQLVVMAALTAITTGREVVILTRDADVLEQYFKLMCLMKEHYRCMLVADLYASYPQSVPFREVAASNDGKSVPLFSDATILEFQTTDINFDPLPSDFEFVNIYCFLLGGIASDSKVTHCCFCAEKGMSRMLQIKVKTDGRVTDRFGDRNCVLHTKVLDPHFHRITASIGRETILKFGPLEKITADDLNNTLFCNEQTTTINWPK